MELVMDYNDKIIQILLAEKEQQHDITPVCQDKTCPLYNKNYRLYCAVGYSITNCSRAIKWQKKYKIQSLKGHLE